MADASTQMLEAAERIVAESGFAAMTVSAVQQAAGQGNKSAVQYHFGDRDGLIRAVLDARMAPANRRRMAMLERLDLDCSLRDLVELYVLPSASRCSPRAELLGPVPPPGGVGPQGRPLGHGVGAERGLPSGPAAPARLDHVPAELRTNRVGGAFGYVCTALAAYEVTGAGGCRRRHLAPGLVDACVGLLSGPSTAAYLQGDH